MASPVRTVSDGPLVGGEGATATLEMAKFLCASNAMTQATVTFNAPAGNEGAGLPTSTVTGETSASHTSKLPPVTASNSPKWETVPQFALGFGNCTSAALLVCPPAPLELPAVPPCVAFQLVSSGATLTRAYPPPVTSVPPPASVGAAVNRAT